MKLIAVAIIGIVTSGTLTMNLYAAREADLARLRSTKQCQQCDLSESNLEQAELNGANLLGANLQKANLKGANLQGADAGPPRPGSASRTAAHRGPFASGTPSGRRDRPRPAVRRR